MHARFDELSEIAAGRRAAGAHLSGCPDCRAGLERLGRVRAGLAALPPFQPPPIAWSAIRERAAAARAVPRWAGPAAAAAACVLVALGSAWLLMARPQPGPAPEAPADAAPMNALVAENARLEGLLSQLPESRTTRLGTAYTVAAIEDRLALVDDRITTVSLEPHAPEVAEDLWRERVTLMNSLVQVQYARALATR